MVRVALNIEEETFGIAHVKRITLIVEGDEKLETSGSISKSAYYFRDLNHY